MHNLQIVFLCFLGLIIFLLNIPILVTGLTQTITKEEKEEQNNNITSNLKITCDIGYSDSIVDIWQKV